MPASLLPWSQSASAYAQERFERARALLQQERARVESGERVLHGEGRPYESREQALEHYDEILQGLGPGLYVADHEQLVSEALRDGDLRPEAVTLDYPHLGDATLRHSTGLGAAGRVRYEEQGGEKRAVLPAPGGDFAGPWAATPQVALRTCLAAFLEKMQVHYLAQRPGESCRALALSRAGDTVQPFCVPGDRRCLLGSDRLGPAHYLYAIRPTLQGGELFFQAAGRPAQAPLCPWRFLERPGWTSYEEAAQDLAAPGVLGPHAVIYDARARTTRRLS